MNITLENIAAQVQRLPMPNTAAMEVIRLCADERSSAAQVAEAISRDQSLTAQVLRVSNSSYFSYPREIATIQRATVILGFNLVKDIAVSFAFQNFYRGFTEHHCLNLQNLWRHALLTAAISRSLSGRFTQNSGDLLYVGGLLHDIGKLALFSVLREPFCQLVRLAAEQSRQLCVIEQDNWGFHHGDVGGILIEHWNLPQILVNIVTYHHNLGDFSGDTNQYRWIQVVYLSNILAHCFERNRTDLATVTQLDANFSQLFTLTEREFDDLVNDVRRALQKNRYLAAMGVAAASVE